MNIEAGLSPRVRGNLDAVGVVAGRLGSIPASAGEPSATWGIFSLFRVYPRECGGTVVGMRQAVNARGLSPRVRGNQTSELTSSLAAGSIPASAGEPAPSSADGLSSGVYPRECGGTGHGFGDGGQQPGLSPRVRGNHPFSWKISPMRGSIPASAGEPRGSGVARKAARVYPRECGGTRAMTPRIPAGRGLSPRVRGNLIPPSPPSSLPRSIPASAGEPRPPANRRRRARVYPRECGGTRLQRSASAAAPGLSPRVRGNRTVRHGGIAFLGSIPASAGEPHLGQRCTRSPRVYPRECGGTRPALRWPALAAGLSPRVRGNLGGGASELGGFGSIPASAGEPTAPTDHARRHGVYPRECGGTRVRADTRAAARGLSPRVRGNRSAGALRRMPSGSIPASAGEPRRWWARTRRRWVYPRECGGTASVMPSSSSRSGLSPRVRGNPAKGVLGAEAGGSIPASAGEPSPRARTRRGGRVYPRECGGTRERKVKVLARQGLSPRVRGNPRCARRRRPARGSIPASAGEPSYLFLTSAAGRVYPRECGGTRARRA